MVTHILPGGLRYLTRSQPPGEVQLAGPTLALVMSMAGRPSHLGQLTGDGVPVLASRLREGA